MRPVSLQAALIIGMKQVVQGYGLHQDTQAWDGVHEVSKRGCATQCRKQDTKPQYEKAACKCLQAAFDSWSFIVILP